MTRLDLAPGAHLANVTPASCHAVREVRPSCEGKPPTSAGKHPRRPRQQARGSAGAFFYPALVAGFLLQGTLPPPRPALRGARSLPRG